MATSSYPTLTDHGYPNTAVSSSNGHRGLVLTDATIFGRRVNYAQVKTTSLLSCEVQTSGSVSLSARRCGRNAQRLLAEI